MRLQNKISSFYLLSISIISAAIIILCLFSFRYFSMEMSKEHARSVAEVVRVGLTELMINGVIANRESYLKRLEQVYGLKSLRVTRSQHVTDQFKKQALQIEKVRDGLDEQVLSSGTPVHFLENEGSNPILRSTIPFIANTGGNPNCLSCHQVDEGTVLGTITIRTELGDLKEKAIMTVIAIALVVVIITLITLFFFRRFFQPLIQMTNNVKKVVVNAKKGKFKSKLKVITEDEVGEIASEMNELLAYLDKGLNHINDNVAQLIDYRGKESEDSLVNTINMIEGLANASKFKQSIEEDETKEEVYVRMARVIEDLFDLKGYSIYEVDNDVKNKMTPVIIDGNADSSCKWCDHQITVRSDACRVKRTGHIIDNIECTKLCNSFNNTAEDGKRRFHVCLPILQSGRVGSVIQIITDEENKANVLQKLPFLQPFLREAAPVIETKRLMSTLRESNLRDAMTGLNNRRFLEEYVETMIATCKRNNTAISILMLDMDYFKKVNDNYGHDVGDKVLVELSKVLVQNVRTSDVVIRYGGEEFLIILQNTKENYGLEVAEKIRKQVEQMKVQIPGEVLRKTISVGIADFPNDSESFWQTVKFADIALYQAKEQGRNRCIHFSEEMWEDNGDY